MVTTKKMEATLYDKLSFNIICGGSHELPSAHSLQSLIKDGSQAEDEIRRAISDSFSLGLC